MDRKIDDEARDKRLDELSMLSFELDDICHEIWFTLMAYKRLRFNELHRYLKKYGTDISKPALIDHLKHLKKRKLITRKREDTQNVSYGLTDEIKNLLDIPPERVREGIERFFDDKDLPEHLRAIPIDEKYFAKRTDSQIDEETTHDLNNVLAHNLWELKAYVDYDLKIDKFESDKVFWNFVGNPLYRMLEKSIVEHCRDSERYKEKLFEKINLLTDELRSDKTLFREREEERRNQLKK